MTVRRGVQPRQCFLKASFSVQKGGELVWLVVVRSDGVTVGPLLPPGLEVGDD